MTSANQRNYKIPFMISILCLFTILVFIIIQKLPPKQVTAISISNENLKGEWKNELAGYSMELNSDSMTYHMRLWHESVEMKGHWALSKFKVDNKSKTLLILQNDIPTTGNDSYPEERYYKYYVFSIDSVAEQKIFVSNLTSAYSSVRHFQKELHH